MNSPKALAKTASRPAREDENMDTKTIICNEILRIMAVYHEQDASPSGIGTPGGLEHMGDVWRLLGRWEDMLKERTP